MTDETTAIGRAIFRAAQHLPEHWAVRIELERNAGTIYLIDPSGYAHLIDGAGELFSEQINAAIDRAAAGRHLTAEFMRAAKRPRMERMVRLQAEELEHANDIRD